jgi:hypothetical protein
MSMVTDPGKFNAPNPNVSVNTTQNDETAPSDIERAKRRKKLFMRIGCMVCFCALLIILGIA